MPFRREDTTPILIASNPKNADGIISHAASNCALISCDLFSGEGDEGGEDQEGGRARRRLQIRALLQLLVSGIQGGAGWNWAFVLIDLILFE